jgi:hypothetical protein
MQVTAKLTIIANFLPKTSSFRICTYQIHSVTDRTTDIANYTHCQTESMDPASYVNVIVPTAEVRIAAMAVVLT